MLTFRRPHPPAKRQVSWTHALRQIVINCYRYHGRDDLLPAFSDDDEVKSLNGSGSGTGGGGGSATGGVIRTAPPKLNLQGLVSDSAGRLPVFRSALNRLSVIQFRQHTKDSKCPVLIFVNDLNIWELNNVVSATILPFSFIIFCIVSRLPVI